LGFLVFILFIFFFSPLNFVPLPLFFNFVPFVLELYVGVDHISEFQICGAIVLVDDQGGGETDACHEDDDEEGLDIVESFFY
jgi:hypothetical protein